MLRRILSAAALASLLVLAGSCARQKTILVFSEPYWQAILDLDPAFSETLARQCRELKFNLTVVETEKDISALEQLRARLSSARPDLVISGPLSSGETLQVAPQFPATTFAVLDMPRLEGAIPGNIIPVRSERRTAFFEAGTKCGEAIAGGRIPGLGGKLGIIASGMTRLEREELAEFTRGGTTHLEAEDILTEEIGTVTDRTRAALAVENLLNQDVKVILVKAYGLTGACLERITQAEAFFIIEDYDSFGLSPEKCLLSIETDYREALSAILTAHQFRPNVPPLLSSRVKPGAPLR